jgi:hypothetical protein
VSSGGEAEPVAVEGVELVWVPDWLALDAWHLCHVDCGVSTVLYTAWSGFTGATREWHGDRPGLVETGISQQAACRWIADRARADGYRVPKHPLGWDVGGER